MSKRRLVMPRFETENVESKEELQKEKGECVYLCIAIRMRLQVSPCSGDHAEARTSDGSYGESCHRENQSQWIRGPMARRLTTIWEISQGHQEIVGSIPTESYLFFFFLRLSPFHLFSFPYLFFLLLLLLLLLSSRLSSYIQYLLDP